MSSILNAVKSKLHKSEPSSGNTSETDLPTADSSSAHPASPHPHTHEHLANALDGVVGNAEKPLTEEDAKAGGLGGHGSALTPAGEAKHKDWFEMFYPEGTVDKLFVHEHMGNWVIDRETKQKSFESMPIYARIGMHLLFYGKAETKLLKYGTVENLLKEQSLKQGKIYDNPDPNFIYPHILAFCKTYSIDTSILAEPDLHTYPSLNSFFSRKLKPEARPIAAPEDLRIVTSAADCRFTVFESVQEATTVWIKGKNFTIPNLLSDPDIVSSVGADPAVAIFRLAPQDYHRYHSPVSGVFKKLIHLPGQYYTVNPQAVNEPGFDVFTANKRDVALIEAKFAPDAQPVPVAFVAVGALLVASIAWTKEVGEPLIKGEDFGYFQYGGSTVIIVFPQGSVLFDEDLVGHSKAGVETVIKMGDRIGVAQGV